MASEPDLATLKRLVDTLESIDAFERRDAIQELGLLTQRQFGFRWRDSDSDRALAVARWRKWLERRAKKLHRSQMQSTVKLLSESSGKPMEAGALQKLLQVLPPEQAKQLMASVLEKVGATQPPTGHPPCDRCGRRPATVKVTHVKEHGHRYEQVCEVCSISPGDA
jgi:hypothetical protein